MPSRGSVPAHAVLRSSVPGRRACPVPRPHARPVRAAVEPTRRGRAPRPFANAPAGAACAPTESAVRAVRSRPAARAIGRRAMSHGHPRLVRPAAALRRPAPDRRNLHAPRSRSTAVAPPPHSRQARPRVPTRCRRRARRAAPPGPAGAACRRRRASRARSSHARRGRSTASASPPVCPGTARPRPGRSGPRRARPRRGGADWLC